jgi:8-oxo-dGTP diphosphatase
VPRQTYVAAGILLAGDGRVLVTERTGDHSFAGLWEFPGGKIEDGEDSLSALRRELGEELGIEVLEQSLFMSLDHDYADRSVSIDFYLIRHWRNTPEGRDGQALKWIRPEELAEDLLLPADAPVIEALQMLGRTSAKY